MEKIILNIWYSNKIFYRLVSYILFPISLLYILIFYLFRIFKTELKIGVPILCVGNINVGGTGKTSTLLEIIKYFKNKEKYICVLLKGYGGKKHKFKKVSPMTQQPWWAMRQFFFQIMYLLIFQQIEY